jgi:hypothetical protein
MKYLVARYIGGVQGNEGTGRNYIEPQIIEAATGDDAKRLYDQLNHCDYFYGQVLAPVDDDGNVTLHWRNLLRLMK